MLQRQPLVLSTTRTPTIPALSGDYELMLGAKHVLPTLETEEHPPDT